MRKITISDTTLLTAESQRQTALSFKEKVEIARHLENVRVDIIELPAIGNVSTDTLFIRTLSSFVEHARVSIDAGNTEESIHQAYQAVSVMKRHRLRISLPVSPVRMEYECHWKAPKMLEKIAALVKEASGLCETEFCAVDATRAEKDFLQKAIAAAVENGASSITLCDDEAAMMPEEFAAFVGEMKQAVGDVCLGVSCRDPYKMAVSSAMQAVQQGADEIKVAAGSEEMPSLKIVGQMLRNCGDRRGITCKLKFTEINRLCDQIHWIIHTDRTASSPFDSSAIAAPAHPEICLTSQSDRAAVIAAVMKLGYDLSEDDHGKVFEAVHHVTEKKNVMAKELDAIVATAALQVPPSYKLISYVINSGNIITASAHIKLEKDGQQLEGIWLGDGPIDAAFLAIEQIIGHHFELDDFQIQSVTEGREAMGSALVRLRSGGKLYSGKGISTDIIGASIRAYISALNKITFEEA